MERHEKIIAILFMFAIVWAFLWSFGSVMEANAHEGHGFKHMKEGETSGPIIKARYCPDGTLLCWIDYNNDGTVDICKKLLFIHDKLHYKEHPPVNNDCLCEEPDEPRNQSRKSISEGEDKDD